MFNKRVVVIGAAVVAATIVAVGTIVWLKRDRPGAWDPEAGAEALATVDRLFEKATEEFPHELAKRNFRFELWSADVLRSMTERFGHTPEFTTWTQQYRQKHAGYTKH